MLGANPEQLKDLAKLLSESSGKLDFAATNLHPTITNARWGGPDAERFRHDWNARMRPQLRTVSGLLVDASKLVNAQAVEQEKASAANDTGGGGPQILGPGTGGTKPELPFCPAKDPNQEILEDMNNRSAEEVQAWWNSLSEDEQAALLAGTDDNDVPNLVYLAQLEDKLPEDVQKLVHAMAIKSGLGTIPIYTITDKVGVDGQVAWVHGGAHLQSVITQNADGSVTLKVSGDVGGGVNTPSTKAGVDATMTGELSKSYTFDSIEDAMAAREQMLNDLPPDTFGRAADAIKNPGEYIEGTLDGAADDNGSSHQSMSAKGTVSLGAHGGLTKDAEASAKLELAYERNLDTQESTASAALSFDGSLDMGEGLKFGGSGEGAFTLNMDPEGDLSKLTIDLKGTVDSSVGFQDNPNPVDPFTGKLPEGVPSEGPSASSTVGVQGTARLELYVTPDNKQLVESYLGNVATGNNAAAAVDMVKIMDASAVTLQANSVASSETNLVDFDSGVASVKIGGSNEVIINGGTLYKTPYANGFETVTGVQGPSRPEVQQ
ncbi:hypothetical protein CVV67_14770 [Arthrobacter stackebrandtii]|nr:hypothetical protein CVV67_14770 [Arthrobacter stackebrandtii]